MVGRKSRRIRTSHTQSSGSSFSPSAGVCNIEADLVEDAPDYGVGEFSEGFRQAVEAEDEAGRRTVPARSARVRCSRGHCARLDETPGRLAVMRISLRRSF